MANATVSQLGQVNAAGDANSLFLKVFSGEVLATFMRENKMLGMTSVRSISSGKSATFPVIGTTSASYHTVGNEITGTQVKHNEKVISIDDLLLSSAFLSNLDEAKNHYDVRSVYSSEMGRALANKVDQHLIQLAVLASQQTTPTITGGNAGEEITDADCNTNAASLITSIFDAAEKLDNKDVPSQDRYCVVTPAIYYNLVENDKILNRDFGGNNGVYSDGTVIKVAGINIVKSPTAVLAFDDNSGTESGTNNTYAVNASAHYAVIFHKSAIGTVKLMDLAMESEYDIRRQGSLMVAKMALGHGILRAESAISIKTG